MGVVRDRRSAERRLRLGIVEGLERRLLLSAVLSYLAPAEKGPDHLLLRVSGDTLELLDNGIHAAELPTAEISSVVVAGAVGRDTTLMVDYSGGSIPPPIAYQGGAGGFNSLVIEGASVAAETYAATDAHDGSITVGDSRITYTNLSPITDTTIATA